MIALLSTHQYEYARHLYRRKACQKCPEMEMLWMVTKHILNNNIPDAFTVLKGSLDSIENIELKGMINNLISSLQVRQKQILANAYTKVDAGFAAKRLGLENSEDAIFFLTHDGWNRSGQNFLSPPLTKSSSSTQRKSIVEGNDALKKMMEVVTFLEYKRLNE